MAAAAAVAAQQQQKFRWSELEDDDGGIDLGTLLRRGSSEKKRRNQLLLVIHWLWKVLEEIEGFVDKPSADGPGRVYVPPNKKEGSDTSGESLMRRRNDENSICVTNLSEDTHEADLLELFRMFGPVTRAFIARDKWTRSSRGFGFVNFVHREDGEKAISKLNGYGYDNLILRVEWSDSPN
ncbi:Eukaryotic translation initiation factor 3 subunit G [Dichanthelium oligosanthes]|uniref:Eukaryotic translation initiation factor 3 subunit G n=1 Tax=Dichanthelium oligosanthes TaxID=888268 RepID=A0A1E5W4Q3_9POAL|nr:Eukaryotic translation initiation factor 3 subunit G [Dichanthelium oligosanthes]